MTIKNKNKALERNEAMPCYIFLKKGKQQVRCSAFPGEKIK